MAILNVETFQWSAVPALPLFLSPRSLHSVVHLGAGPTATHELWCYGGRNSAFTTIPGWDVLHLPQEGTPATADKKPAAAAATAAKKPTAAASSSASASSARPPIVAAAELDSAAASSSALDEDAGEIAGESAGSGSIMDAFLSQQKK